MSFNLHSRTSRMHSVVSWLLRASFFFLFNDPATPAIYTLSLHDALPICACGAPHGDCDQLQGCALRAVPLYPGRALGAKSRSEEHTSELQSQFHLVCRLLLEKKKR